MIVLAELQPLDRLTNTRKMLRAASANHRDVNALNGVVWRPAISGEPSTDIRLFKGDFDGQAAPAGGSISIQIDQFLPEEPNARSFAWQGAPVKFYAGEIGQPWPWQEVFSGLVDQGTAEKNKVSLTCRVNTSPFDADILTLKYTGSGGSEGPDDFKDTLKPWLLGRCFNVEPRLINAVDSVYQFSAYASIQAVTALYERGSDFGPASANYATYAALVAATIAPGAWATCLASGMIRLGAPAFGVITGDVDGDNFGGIWRSTTGAIILRVANGISPALIESASFAALDTAMQSLTHSGMIGIYLTDQESVLQFAARLASPCNAQVGVSLLGKMFVGRVAFGEPALTLDAQQRQLPAVISSSETTTSPPYSYIEMGYARSWRVHTDDEIIDYKALIGDVEAANAAIAAIGNDNLISASEKPNLIFRRDVILSVQSSTVNTAAAHGISSAAYTAAITALTNYLATLTAPTLWSNLGGDTNVDGPTLRARFKTVYDEHTILSNVIAARTATVEAGATVGGKLGTNVTNASGAIVNEADIDNRYNDQLTNFVAYGTGGGQIVGNVLYKTGGFGNNVAIISEEGGRAFSVTCRYDFAGFLGGVIGLTNMVIPITTNQSGYVCYARLIGSGQAGQGSSIQFFVTGVAASPSFTVAAAQIGVTGTIQVVYEGANCLFYVNGVLLHQAVSTVQGAVVRACYMPAYANLQGQVSHVSYSAANNAQWASIGGAGVPADNASANVSLAPFGTGIVFENNRFKNTAQNISAGIRTIGEIRGGATFQFRFKGILATHVSLYDPAAALPANNGGLYYAVLNKVAGTETWTCTKRNIHAGQAFATVIPSVTWTIDDYFGIGYDGAKWYIFKNGLVVFSENAAAEGLRLKGQIVAYAGSSPNAWVADYIEWLATTDNGFASLGGAGLPRAAYETSQGLSAGFAGQALAATDHTIEAGANRTGVGGNLVVKSSDVAGMALHAARVTRQIIAPFAGGVTRDWNRLVFGPGSGLAVATFNNDAFENIVPGEILFVSADGYSASTSHDLRLALTFYDGMGAALETLYPIIIPPGPAVWRTFIGRVLVPVNAAKMKGSFQSLTQTSGTWYAANPFIGSAQKGADVTAESQVMIAVPPPQIIYRDYLGAPKNNQYPLTITPGVKRGGGDIRISNDCIYSISVPATMTAAINNVAGSPDKGRITVTSGFGSIAFSMTVLGVSFGPFPIPVTTQDDPPPSQTGGGGTTKSASDASLAGVNSNVFAAITSTGAGENLFALTLAAGEKLKGAGTLSYQSYAGNNRVIAQWEYRMVPTPTWLALGAAPISGSISLNEINAQEEEILQPGSITATQEKAGLAAGQYEMRLVARGEQAVTNIEFYSGTATAMAQP